MKNVFLVLFLSIGLLSFNSVTTDIKDNIILNQELWQIDYNVVNDLDPFVCTATVTYNGVAVHTASGTGSTPEEACSNAETNACAYIQQQGGTCPQHQQ